MISLIFLILAISLAVFLYGGSLFLQSFIYNAPTTRLPERSAIAGVGIALFLTFWCWLHSQNPDRFNTLFEFSSLETKEYDHFESVRLVGGNKEEIIPYQKKPGGKGSSDYFDARKGKKPTSWVKNDTDGVVKAILIQEEGKAEPTRFETNLDKNNRFPPVVRYTEKGGSRYLEVDNIGRVIRKRSSTLVWNFLLNVFHYGAWFLALWLGLRYTSQHAIGIAIICWIVVLVVVLPVLFTQARGKNSPSVSSTIVSPN